MRKGEEICTIKRKWVRRELKISAPVGCPVFVIFGILIMLT